MRTVSPTMTAAVEGVSTIDATEGLGGGSGAVLLSEHATITPRTARGRQRVATDAGCLTVLGIWCRRRKNLGVEKTSAPYGRFTVKLETLRNSTGSVHYPGMSSNRCRSKCCRLRRESLT